MNDKFTVITWDEWISKYKPVLSEGHPIMYETYGIQLKIVQDTDSSLVWTLGEESGESYIDAGCRFVNRLGYYICQVPWEHPDIQVQF